MTAPSGRTGDSGRPRYYDALSGRQLAGPPAGVILQSGESPAPEYLVGPALFDPQVNGFAGVDFQDPDLDAGALERATAEVRRAGCAHFLLTLITASPAFLEAQLRRVAECLAGSQLARETILGIHLEGPFLSDEDGFAAAHPREHLRAPDWALFERLQRAAGGQVRLVTLAPELPGAIPFIERATAAGVWTAVGHTNASLDELAAAARAGARLATHLGNGCPARLPRHDNIIQRILAVPELTATVIPDGLHVPPPALANLTRALGPTRLAMTTDAMSAAAAPSGAYRLGSLELQVGEDRRVAHPDGDYFAGSSLRMAEGLLNLVRFGGLDACQAWRAWTSLRRRMFPGLEAPTLLLPFHTGRNRHPAAHLATDEPI